MYIKLIMVLIIFDDFDIWTVLKSFHQSKYSIIDNDSVLAHNSMYWIFMKSCPLWQLFVISRSSISVNNKKYHRSYFFIRFDLYGDKHFFPVAFQILMFLRRNKWVLMANTYIEILDFYWEMGWTVFECKSYYSIFYIFYISILHETCH